MKRATSLLITAAFVIAALAMDVIVPWMLYQGYVSTSWRTTEAEIQKVEWKRGRKNRRELVVTYSYEVAGKQYSGNRVSWGIKSPARVRQEYLEGSRASVSYNPSDPASSVLEPGIEWYNLFFLILPLMFSGIALLLVRAAVRGR